ncbi:MAG TPA: hypothetical protein DCQ94_09475 [Nitrospira sp.]|nr:hypothetical protein [Nitrospira sp.]
MGKKNVSKIGSLFNGGSLRQIRAHMVLSLLVTERTIVLNTRPPAPWGMFLLGNSRSMSRRQAEIALDDLARAGLAAFSTTTEGIRVSLIVRRVA